MSRNKWVSFQVIVLVLLVGFFLGGGVASVLYAQESGGRASEAQQQPALPNGTGLNAVTLAGALDTNFVTRVFDQAGPAVVYITTQKRGFDLGLRPAVQEGVGSGFVVDPDGYILTNAHVVLGADTITVVLANDKEFSASVVGSDISTDLALIKIDPGAEKLPIAKLGDSGSLRIGDWVIAIGNPYGFDRTVTFGVVSSNERTIRAADQRTIPDVIQTDAAINPGNSGGPLLNATGEVVGITSVILSQSGGSEGIGLAIPINTAKDIMGDLIKYGRVLRPWLGVEVDPRVAWYRLPVKKGLLVSAVYKDSPAAAAGLLPPVSNRAQSTYKLYIITAADDKPVADYGSLLDIVRAKPVDGTVKLTVSVVENGNVTEESKTVQLAALPPEAPITGVI
jgi:serine protease Do